MQEKGIQSTKLLIQRVQKQWSLANLRHLNNTDPLLDPSLIISFCYCERVHHSKNVNLGIQSLAMNPKSRPVKSNSEQYHVLSKYVSSKN